jgi:hypothetical protein
MASQSITSHPVYVQASNKAKYYNAQLDKEVLPFFLDFSARVPC